jgi:hypothetical protein
MASARRLAWWLGIALALIVTFAAGWLAGRSGIGPTVAPSSLAERERQFAERMRGSALVGHFTVDGRATRDASADRYDIESVEKIGEDLWRFNARMRHDGFDATLPMAIPVTFVGDTPLIVMTDYTIPTLGTFTVRLFFHGDRYAGTWQHGAVGGLMYGRIERQSR